jgi:hypothetical protein
VRAQRGDARRCDGHDDRECGAARELQQRMEPDTRPLVEPVVQNNAGARKKLAALSSVSNT